MIHFSHPAGEPAAPDAASARPVLVQQGLKAGGLTPFTATDFPGKLAAVVFVQGCPWRCGYCHNPHLQERTREGALPWNQVMELLSRRAGLIDAVVFSGGEPTLDPALKSAILDVRSLGFEIGLHTSGSYPARLADLLPLIDWIGMDVKAPFDCYERITGIAGSGAQARSCAEAILFSGVPHEFRTTIHPALLAESEIAELAAVLSEMGVRHYALQKFRSTGCQDNRLTATSLNGYPGEDLIGKISGLFPHFILRNV